MGGLPKLKVCKGANLYLGPGGLLKTAEGTIGRVGLPPHSPSVPVVTKDESRWVWLVLGHHHGDSQGKMSPGRVELVLGLHLGDSKAKMSPGGWS